MPSCGPRGCAGSGSRWPPTGSRPTGRFGRRASTTWINACARARMAAMPEADISITRVFDAPREEVWREWTEPEAFADWFGGPQADNPLSSVSMDVQPGGQWRLTMYFGPRRHEIRWMGEYQEVVPPERLVFTVTDQPDNPTFD